MQAKTILLFLTGNQDSRRPDKLYDNVASLGRRVAASLAIAVAITSITSCASDKHHWHSGVEAVNEYRDFLEQTRKSSNNSMEAIAKDIVAWQTLEDSVYAFIENDTAKHKPHYYPLDIVRNIHDSVREEILNRAKAQPRSLKDVYLLKRTTNRCARDPKIGEAAKAAMPFFLSLDSVNIYNSDCRSIVRRYRTYLYNVEKRGINDREQWLSFMREEDRLFRSFVTHMHEMDGVSATDITKTTENIYRQLSQHSASTGISHSDLMLYLTMRTNRRLLANATTCVADIKANKVRNADQQKAYLWMVMQPFVSTSDLGMALLTEKQQKDFEQLAKYAPTAIRSIANRLKLPRDEYDCMPDLIIKIYISSL